MSSVREMTTQELIENCNLNNNTKELILQRLKEESELMNRTKGNYEDTLCEQRCLIEAYRTVLADMVYSNWLNRK